MIKNFKMFNPFFDNLFIQKKIISIILTYIGICGIKNYKIYKNINKKEISIIPTTQIKATFSKKDKERLDNIKLGNKIINFKETLDKNINSDNLNILNQNIKTLKIKKKYILAPNLLFIPIAGYYNPRFNKIKILNFCMEECIYHELFHSASSIYDKNKKISFVGFQQYNTKRRSSIGTGLNEGYTQLLSERYFYNSDIVDTSYKICMFFSKYIEKIITKEKMEKLYLNADLLGLINELEKYDTKENIIDFINSLDVILRYFKVIYSKNYIYVLPSLKKEITKCFIKLQEYITKWYLKKLKNELDLKLLTTEQFFKNISKFYYNLTNNTTFKEINAKTINFSKMCEMLNDITGEKKNTIF